MNFFKSVVLAFFTVLYFASMLFAQLYVTDEQGFRNGMSWANPDLRILNSIYFTQSFADTTNKDIKILLNSGVSLDGTSIPSTGHGFRLSGSTLTFTSDASNVVTGFASALSGENGSVLNFYGQLTFANNYNGSAVMLASGSIMNFNGSNIIFRQNSANAPGASNGGALLVSGGSEASFNASENIFFNLNDASGSGGAAYISDNSLLNFTGNSVYFRNNSSQEYGGGIYAVNGSTVNVSGSYIEFRGNTSQYSGGALYGGNNSYFNINADNIVFETGASKGSDSLNAVGGVAYAANSRFDFGGQNASFQDNGASGNGGAFFATDNSVFNFNSATNTFSGNEAGERGGAVYSEQSSQFTFNGGDLYFDINSASSFGGAIDALSGSEFTFSSSRTHFQYNKAANGGAIHADDSLFAFNGDDLYFTRNNAKNSGGALYAENNAVVDFLSDSNIFRYNTASNGGAIYMGESTVTIDNARFLANEASSQGGAIYMNGTSFSNSADLNVRALTSDVLFSGNTASGSANDIYMHQYGNIEFNADTGRKITLDGGISGRADYGNSIVKTGAGVLEFAGDHSNYKGDLTVSAGTLAVINDVAVTAANFEVQSGAVYSTVNGYGEQVTTVGSAQIQGEYGIDIDFSQYKADKMVSASGISATSDGRVNLDSGSALNINSAGTLGIGTSRIVLIEAENGITGTFSSDNFASLLALFPQDTTAFIEYLSNRVELYLSRVSSFNTITRMTHNQKEVAVAFDEISRTNTTANMSSLLTQIDAMANDPMKRSAFDRLSGSFIANAVTAGALRNGMNELYNRLQPRYCPHDSSMSRSLWGQFYISNDSYDEDDNSIKDFNITGYGIQAGFDLFTGEASLGGLYISYGQNDLEQGDDEADMQDYELGLYGGWFGEKIDIKGSLSGGVQNFDLKRNIKFAGLRTNADFNTYSVRADGQIEFKVGIGNGSLELRPFVGLQGGYVMNEKIEEKNGGAANLIIDANDYLRVKGLGGIGIGNTSEKFNWYGKLYAGYLIAGTRNEFDGKFKDHGKKMNILGAEVGEFGGGAGLGGEYNLNKRWSLYANANAGYAEGTSGYYGNIGINYSFCPDSDRSQSRKSSSAENYVYDKAIVEQDTKKEAVEEPGSSIDANIVYDEPLITETASYAEPQESITAAPERMPAVAIISEEKSPEFEETATFVPSNHDVNRVEKERIRQQAEEIKKKGYNNIVVRGHTDSTGNDTVNNRLSLQRAKVVYEELIANGIDPDKITYVGYADRKPVATNATQEGMSLNRRTDIVVDGPVIMPGVIYTASYFASNGYSLNENGKEKAKEQAAGIKAVNYDEVIIEGHADSTGSDAINKPLSESRAKSVYDEFLKNGIPADKMSYKGYGSDIPIDTNSTGKGRANNRRVEVIVK